MHLLVTQTCDTEIVHHALMSNTPTCDIVFMMYKGDDVEKRLSVSSVLHTSHHAHFIAFSDPHRYLILFPAPARALSQLLQYSLSSAGCVLSARIPGGGRPTRPYMGSRPTRPPMGSRPTGSPGGGSRLVLEKVPSEGS